MNLRKAILKDAERISYIWDVICSEKIYSAVNIPFTAQHERNYILSLSEREGVFLAEVEKDIVGFQSLELWSKVINSFEHVGSIGTFILPQWRGKNVAYSLANYTFEFARFSLIRLLLEYMQCKAPPLFDV